MSKMITTSSVKIIDFSKKKIYEQENGIKEAFFAGSVDNGIFAVICHPANIQTMNGPIHAIIPPKPPMTRQQYRKERKRFDELSDRVLDLLGNPAGEEILDKLCYGDLWTRFRQEHEGLYRKHDPVARQASEKKSMLEELKNKDRFQKVLGKDEYRKRIRDLQEQLIPLMNTEEELAQRLLDAKKKIMPASYHIEFETPPYTYATIRSTDGPITVEVSDFETRVELGEIAKVSSEIVLPKGISLEDLPAPKRKINVDVINNRARIIYNIKARPYTQR